MLILPDGQTRTIPREAAAARIETRSGEQVSDADGVPILAPPRFVAIRNLPERAEGTLVIVSQLLAVAVAALLPDRTDVVYPGTAASDRPLRTQGGIRGVRRLIRAVV